MANPPTSGTDLVSLGISVDATQPALAATELDKLGTATVKVIKNIDDLADASQANSKWVADATSKYKNQIEVLTAQWKAEQDVLKVEREAIAVRAAAQEASTGLISKLEQMIAVYGLTREEILRLTAAELNMSAAAEPLIAQLEALKAATAQYGVVITDVASIEAARIEFETNAAIVFSAFKKRTLAENAAAEEAAATALNAQRIRSLAENQAAEEAAATALQAFKIRTMAENRAAAIIEIEKMEAVRLADYEKQKADAIVFAAFKNRTLAENAAAELAKEKELADAAIALAEKQAIEQIAWEAKSVKGRILELERLKAYQANPSISQSTVDTSFSSAAIKDLPNLTTLINKYNESLGNSHGASKKLGDATNELGISFNNNRARTEALVLAHEALQGRYTRMPGSLMVLAEYTNAASLVTSAFGIAILGTVAAIGLFVYETVKGIEQTKAFNDALNRTNDVSGETISRLTDLAEAAGGVHGQFKEAYEAAAELTRSGKFTADQIDDITRTVVDLNHAFGTPIQDTIKEFESLVAKASTTGVTSILPVSKAVVALDEKYHFLNDSLLEQIITLEKEGKSRDASALAIKAYTEEGMRAKDAAQEYTGYFVTAWHGVTGAINEALQGLANFGKAQTNAQKVAELSDLLNKKDAFGPVITDDKFNGNQRTAMLADLALAQAQLNMETTNANHLQEVSRKQSVANAALLSREIEDKRLMKKSTDELTEALAKNKQQTDDIEAAQPGYIANNQKYLEEREAAIVKAHTTKASKTVNDGRKQDLLDALQNADAVLAATKSGLDSRDAILAESYRNGLISASAYYAGLKTDREAEQVALDKDYKSKIDTLNNYTARSKVDAEETKKRINEVTNAYSLASQKIKEAGDLANVKQVVDTKKEDDKADSQNLKEVDAINKEIAAIQQKIDAYNSLPEAIKKSGVAAKQMSDEITQASIDSLQTQLDALQQFFGEDDAVAKHEIENLKTQIALKKQLRDVQVIDNKNTADNKFALGEATRQKADAKAAEKAWTDSGKNIAKALSESFGEVGQTIGNVFKIFADGQANQLKLTQELSEATARAGDNQLEKAKAQDDYNAHSNEQRLGDYGDLAGAASKFFDTQSTGYKALQAVSQVFHAAELAMSIAELVPKATAAVLNQGSGDPYTAFGRMAAMAAIVVGLGVAIGGVGGSSSQQTSAQRQAANGTGSILGDSTAKSDSISKSITNIEKDSGLGLAHTISIDSSLKQVVAGISSLGSVLLRNTGLTSTTAANSTGAASNLAQSMVSGPLAVLLGGPIGAISTVLDKITGGLVSKVTGKITNAIFGGNTTVLDTGLTVGKTTVGNAITNGVSASQYADTKTDGGWFSSDKYKTSLASLGSDADDQFSLVFKSLAASIKASAQALGLGGDDFEARLNSFVIDIGKISTKGLTGTEIQTALENAVSKVGDDMAAFSVKGLEQFTQVGEGYLETLTRVANDYIQVSDVLKVLGKSFNATGADAVKLSEGLITAAGSLDTLTTNTSYFVENFLSESEKMKAITDSVQGVLATIPGGSGINTIEQFKNLVLAQDLNTTAGQALYAQLIAIAPQFKTMADYLADIGVTVATVVKSASEIASERKSLQDQYDTLTMTSTELRAKERAAIDASNLALYDSVQAAQAVADAKASAETDLQNAYDATSSAATAAIAANKAFATSLRQFNTDLLGGDLSTLTPQQKYQAALDEYQKTAAAAAAGDSTAQSAYTTVANAFLEASKTVNASNSQYQADFAMVQQLTEDTAKNATITADVQQSQLDTLNKQLASLVTIEKAVMSIPDALAALNAITGGTTVVSSALSAATGTGNTTSSAASDSTIDYSSYGTTGMGALTEEIKNLRAALAEQTIKMEAIGATAATNAERAEAVAYDATDKAADKEVAGINKALVDSAYVAANKTLATT